MKVLLIVVLPAVAATIWGHFAHTPTLDLWQQGSIEFPALICGLLLGKYVFTGGEKP